MPKEVAMGTRKLQQSFDLSSSFTMRNLSIYQISLFAWKRQGPRLKHPWVHEILTQTFCQIYQNEITFNYSAEKPDKSEEVGNYHRNAIEAVIVN